VFDLDGVKVVIDYAHNAAGLEALGDFVERLIAETPGASSANLRVGVVATAGDRRDEDMRQLGRVAARYFDEVIVREDRNPRGRERGKTAELILEGVALARADGGTRAGHVEIVLDEMEAARRALDRSRPGDVVVLCVDYATEVYAELEKRRGMAAPRVLLASEGNGQFEAVGGDPDLIELVEELGL
jgi:cyanophycin synthetase